MATDGKRELPAQGTSSTGGSFAKWALGALGLLGIFSLTARASQRRRSHTAELDQIHPRPFTYRTARSRLKHRPHPVRGHEQRDANARWVFGIVIFLLVSVFLIQIILGRYLSWLNRKPTPTDNWQPVAGSHQSGGSLPPEPRLQVSAPADLRAFRQREDEELQSYGWINQTAGVVRIPIDRAMELVLERGLPTRANANQNQLGPSSYDLIQQRAAHREPEIQGEK